MAEETTISMAGVNAPPLYRLVEDGGKTVIMTADTNTPMWVINGKIGGDTVETMTTAERTAITPEAGQLIYDTDEGALYVGDGATAGGVAVGSGGGGGGGTPATVSDIMTGSGASKILNVSNLRGALTAGQAVDVTSQPDSVTGDYRGTFSVTGSLGFASFPKYAASLNYLMIADLTATTSGTVTPSGTWLDGTTTAKSLAAGTSTRVAMTFNAVNKAKFTFASTGSVSVTNCREYEVTACSTDAIAYIAALSNPDSFQNYYLVKRDMVSPWTNIIDMGESPTTTVAAGLAYQIRAMTGSHIITVDTCPEGYVGRETFVRIFVGQTGNVVVQSPLQLATPLVANAINNCTISYRDGTAVLTVEDTVGGYIVEATSGTTAGTLYYGIMDSATEFVSIPGAFDGIPVDLGGASVTTSGTAQKYVVGNGVSNTLISGNLNAGAGKLNLSNIALSDCGITGGTMTIPNGVVLSGTVTVSSGASAIFNGGAIAAGATVAVSGGGLAVEKVTGDGGVIDLGGTVLVCSAGSRMAASGVAITSGRAANGGGIYVNSGAATLSGCTIASCVATNDGGAMRINNGSATLTDCQIVSNTASRYCGGIVLTSAASATFTRCQFSSNTGTFARDLYISTGAVAELTDCALHSVRVTGGTLTLTETNSINSVVGSNGLVNITSNAVLDFSSASNATVISAALIAVAGKDSTNTITVLPYGGGTSTTIVGGTYTQINNDGTTIPAQP